MAREIWLFSQQLDSHFSGNIAKELYNLKIAHRAYMKMSGQKAVGTTAWSSLEQLETSDQQNGLELQHGRSNMS